jgi:hypothetical protein
MEGATVTKKGVNMAAILEVICIWFIMNSNAFNFTVFMMSSERVIEIMFGRRKQEQ